MDSILSLVRTFECEMIELTRRFVECESPSDDTVAVNRFVELLSDTLAPFASIETCTGGQYGNHLVAEMNLPGPKKDERILVLGHTDTVWPLGTLRGMPFRRDAERLWGPGVFDMKGGIAFFLFAVRALRELDIPVASPVCLQLNSDEEVGSPSSRALTEKNAARAAAVLVLEPGAGLNGKAKTARKGVGEFRITVRGRAAHAGLDYEAGASAIQELARQIDRIAAFTHYERGITVNPGVIAGGTRSNVIAEEAHADIDVRVIHPADARHLEQRFRELRPYNSRCSLEISGGLNRPPMPRSPGAIRLLKTAQRLARELDVELEETQSGGGSDGNFTAALGIPTLDGLGAVGEGAHAANESLLIERMADRTALIAKLLAAL